MGYLKRKAKEAVKGNLGFPLLSNFLMFPLLIVGLVVIPIIGAIFVFAAFSYSIIDMYIRLSRGKKVNSNVVYSGFSKLFLVVRLVMVKWLIMFAVFLIIGAVAGGGYLILMITKVNSLAVLPIGGVVLGIAGAFLIYFFNVRMRFAFHVLVDSPEIDSASYAVKESFRITKGLFWKVFVFDLSYLGWFLLTPFTLGLLAIWLIPYYFTARANFYNLLVDKFDEVKEMNFDEIKYNLLKEENL